MDMDTSVCDFCDSPFIIWRYPSSFLGGWNACEACATLIEAGDRDGLAERATAVHGADPSLLLAAVPQLADPEAAVFAHSFFWSSRCGERVRIVPRGTDSYRRRLSFPNERELKHTLRRIQRICSRVWWWAEVRCGRLADGKIWLELKVPRPDAQMVRQLDRVFGSVQDRI